MPNLYARRALLAALGTALLSACSRQSSTLEKISQETTISPKPTATASPTAQASPTSQAANLETAVHADTPPTAVTAVAIPSAAASAVPSATAAGVPTDAPGPSPTAQPSPTLAQIVTASPTSASGFTYITEADFPHYLQGTPEHPLKRIIEPVEYINRTIVQIPVNGLDGQPIPHLFFYSVLYETKLGTPVVVPIMGVGINGGHFERNVSADASVDGKLFSYIISRYVWSFVDDQAREYTLAIELHNPIRTCDVENLGSRPLDVGTIVAETGDYLPLDRLKLWKDYRATVRMFLAETKPGINITGIEQKVARSIHPSEYLHDGVVFKDPKLPDKSWCSAFLG